MQVELLDMLSQLLLELSVYILFRNKPVMLSRRIGSSNVTTL